MSSMSERCSQGNIFHFVVFKCRSFSGYNFSLCEFCVVADSPGRPVGLFTPPDVYNSTTLLLSEDEETLFVGARDALLSVNVSQRGGLVLNQKLDWSPTEKDLNDCSMKGKKKTDCPNFVRVLQVLNSTHMYACGTFAFSPRCTYISIKCFIFIFSCIKVYSGFCVPLCVLDGELYTGTVADYRGNRPIISRHLSEGEHVDVKLDDTMGWLEDPTFISSTFIPSEEKVYFFFSELAGEYDFINKFTVSRIAQVCTSDVGGQRTLQRRWTTFTKLPYNVLQDMTTLHPPEGASEDDTLFYGIFSSQWSVNSGRSAVCAFRLRAIKDVFSGNYKYLNRDTVKWSTRVQEKIANPGECGLHNASDNTLRFVKENFLADESILPVNQELTIVSPDHQYSNIAAQRVRAAGGKDYTVLYLLTETGYLHKAVLLDKGAHIIEEIQVFTKPQPVKNLLLSVTKGLVLVGTSEGIASVPVSNCSYYSSCAECVLARDPFCGWDLSRRACVDIDSVRENVGQDVEGGNVSEVCKPRLRSFSLKSPASELVYVSLNEVVHLRCPAASHLAQLHWERLNSQISPKIYMQHEDGSLSFLATPSTLGQYLCQAVENGFTQTLYVYQVRQKSNPTVQPSTPSRPQITRTSESGRGSTDATTKGVTTPQTKDETVRKYMDIRERQLLAKNPSYLQELVVVSVLLALCISALLTIALFSFRQRCHIRTAPHSPGSRRDAERAGEDVSHEREALKGNAPGAGKQNGHAHGVAKSPNSLSNGALNGSNGHLPNTPI
uniref:Sema domain-containing protein n=1 Tax=Astyanax mexicanus TaxID=7994 RepID=W5LCT9_ASTMX